MRGEMSFYLLNSYKSKQKLLGMVFRYEGKEAQKAKFRWHLSHFAA